MIAMFPALGLNMMSYFKEECRTAKISSFINLKELAA